VQLSDRRQLLELTEMRCSLWASTVNSAETATIQSPLSLQQRFSSAAKIKPDLANQELLVTAQHLWEAALLFQLPRRTGRDLRVRIAGFFFPKPRYVPR
jgi:hypothetical protein